MSVRLLKNSVLAQSDPSDDFLSMLSKIRDVLSRDVNRRGLLMHRSISGGCMGGQSNGEEESRMWDGVPSPPREVSGTGIAPSS